MTLVRVLGSVEARDGVLSQRALLLLVKHEADHGRVAD